MTLKFKGFSQSSSVALSVSSGGATKAASVASWGSQAAVAVQVTQHQLGVAPHAAIFEIGDLEGFDTPAPTGVYDARLHDFAFLWDFDDPSGPAWTAPEQLFPGHNDPDKAYGHSAAHVYTLPGTYYPSVLVIELSSGKTATWTSDGITVADPDTYFSGSDTWYVYRNSTANAPSGATIFGPGVGGAWSAIWSMIGESTPKRIMFERGQTWDITGLTWEIEFDCPNMYLCADSSAGADPIISTENNTDNHYIRSPGTAGGAGKDIVIKDLDFVGNWDAINCKSKVTPAVNARRFFLGSNNRSLRWGTCLFHDVTMRDMLMGTEGVCQPTEAVIFHNCVLKNFQDYGAIESDGGNNGKLAFVGTRIMRDASAGMGPSGRQVKQYSPSSDGVMYNYHGPIRVSQAKTFIIDACDIYSAAGWTGNVRQPYNVAQPCWRFGLALDANYAPRINIQRNALEGVGNIGAFSNLSGSANVMNCVIERNMMWVPKLYDGVFNTTHNGITFRNNQIAIGDVTGIDGQSWGKVLVDAAADGGIKSWIATTGGAQIKAEYNTIIAHGTGRTSWTWVEEPSGVTVGQTIANNIIHRPDASSTPDAPLDVSMAMFTPRFAGYRRSTEKFTGTLAGDVVNGGTLRVLYADGERGDGQQSWFRTVSAAAHVVYIESLHYLGSGALPNDHTDGHTLIESEISCAFDATGCTITNNSGVTWPSGDAYTVVLERFHEHSWVETSTAPSPGLAVLARPAIGSPALGAATTDEVYDDFSGAVRPLYPSIGALEAAQ